MNPFSISNKHILITGASSGIGRQCAITCSQMGAKVTLLGRDEIRLREVLSLMEGDEHLILVEDISITSHIKRLVETSINSLGKVDGFIHAAGIEGTLPINSLNEEKYIAYFKINVIAGFEFIKYLAKKKNFNNKGASFVLLGSVMGTLGEPGKVAYCSSKGALVNGVKALALELSSKNIRINSISPGIVETPMTKNAFEMLPKESVEILRRNHPLGFGKPEDIAKSILFFLSGASKWITGTNLIIDGGYSAK